MRRHARNSSEIPVLHTNVRDCEEIPVPVDALQVGFPISSNLVISAANLVQITGASLTARAVEIVTIYQDFQKLNPQSGCFSADVAATQNWCSGYDTRGLGFRYHGRGIISAAMIPVPGV